MTNESNESNRYAPPTAHVADMAAGSGTALAGRGVRLGAVLIDVLVTAVVVWIVSLVTPWSPFSAPAPGGLGLALVSNVIGGFAVFLLVQGYLLVTQGQTVGKKLLGIRIVRSNGEKADAARLLGMRYGIGYVITMIPFLGGIYGLVDSLLIFRESRQCLHDTIADTIVVVEA